MIPRMTTVGTLKNYRYNLNVSNNTLGKTMNTVTTRRLFSSYAEDPSLATRCFQIRRSYWRAESQYSVNEALCHRYDVAWSTLETVSTDLYSRADDASIASIVRAATDSTGPGRLALGQSLSAKAQDIAQAMNGRYSENFVFAGADTLNPPFTWGPQVNPKYDSTAANPVEKYIGKDGQPTNDESEAAQGLYFRGVAVDSNDPKDLEKMKYFQEEETKNIDVGLGHKEEDGEAVDSTMFNFALQGVYYLGGNGTGDVEIEIENGGTMTIKDVPKNVASIVNEMGQILQRCNKEDGDWASTEDKQRFQALFQAYESSESNFRERWTAMDTQAGFLQDNAGLLQEEKDSLREQYMTLEDADPAAAISDFMFARYCYDAALKVGNSVLSQSLMDYMRL